ncbi:unnamed protein product [Moneuplotes crassus]|uniref:Uncharacterized protein n=1 Tax=Euplotes crassus TaxID=5936 RepID=A0AAD1Y7U3_EUPCR|nr:unnamed protein product [Moneuplotes crassus]
MSKKAQMYSKVPFALKSASKAGNLASSRRTKEKEGKGTKERKIGESKEAYLGISLRDKDVIGKLKGNPYQRDYKTARDSKPKKRHASSSHKREWSTSGKLAESLEECYYSNKKAIAKQSIVDTLINPKKPSKRITKTSQDQLTERLLQHKESVNMKVKEKQISISLPFSHPKAPNSPSHHLSLNLVPKIPSKTKA